MTTHADDAAGSIDLVLRRPQLILSLCDFSGVWSQPYVDDGYDVIRVDLKHTRVLRGEPVSARNPDAARVRGGAS